MWIYIAQPGSWSAGRVISIPVMVAIAGLLHLGARTPLPAALGAEPRPAGGEIEPTTEPAARAR
jgi:hypothetical protein